MSRGQGVASGCSLPGPQGEIRSRWRKEPTSVLREVAADDVERGSPAALVQHHEEQRVDEGVDERHM